MKSKPFVIKPNMTGQALVPIRPDEKRFSETWLQQVLQSYPQILPVDEIEPVFWPLVPIGREIGTSVGPIDNLFVSRAGYLVVVETKLWRNSQAKREVFAQAIDYASELAGWSFEQLDAECHRRNKKGVIQLIESFFDSDPEELPTEDSIAQNLRLGRFLILVVSDHIHNSLINMLKFVNRYPHLATNVGLIELHCYLAPDHQNEIIVVPSIIARTEIVERSIVQVNIVPDLKHQISVEQIKTPSENRDGGPLSEDEFWKNLKQKSLASIEKAKRILDHFGKYPEIQLKMRRSAVVARMNIPESDQRLSLFFINTDGKLVCWPSTILVQLENAGLDQNLGTEYEAELSKLLKKKSKSLSIHYPVENVDVNVFISTVDNFIQRVLKAQTTIEND
jgi:hypothetical protein